MSVRILNIADLHASGDPLKQQKFLSSAEEILEYVYNNRPHIVLISGDVWDKPQFFREGSGVSIVTDFLISLSYYCTVFIVKGNNAHDAPGSISLLHQLRPNIYAYEKPVSLVCYRDDSGYHVAYDILDPNHVQVCPGSDDDIIVSLVPYPDKASFIFPGSIDENNQSFEDKFASVFELLNLVTSDYNCPKILGAHMNVVGSRTSTGQPLIGQEIQVSPEVLNISGHHYIGIGHIHAHTVFQHTNSTCIVMVGSFYNCNWGELDKKGFSEAEIEYDENQWRVYHSWVPFRYARPMVALTGKWDNEAGTFQLDSSAFDIELAKSENSFVRFRYSIRENERDCVTEGILNEIRAEFGRETLFEEDIIPVEREQRSSEIINVNSLTDETIVYANDTNQTELITESIKDKIAQIEESVL